MKDALKLWNAYFAYSSTLVGVVFCLLIVLLRFIATTNSPLMEASMVGWFGIGLAASSLTWPRPYIEYLACLPMTRTKSRLMPYALTFLILVPFQVIYVVFEYSGAIDSAVHWLATTLKIPNERFPQSYSGPWPALGGLGWSTFCFFITAYTGDLIRFNQNGLATHNLFEKFIICIVALGMAMGAWLGGYSLLKDVLPFAPQQIVSITGMALLPLSIFPVWLLRQRVVNRDTNHYPVVGVL